MCVSTFWMFMDVLGHGLSHSVAQVACVLESQERDEQVLVLDGRNYPAW